MAVKQRGSTSQTRRRNRRAALRNKPTVEREDAADVAAIQELVASVPELRPERAALEQIDEALSPDQVLVLVDGTYHVASLTTGADGEPTISARDEWVPVESAWVETPAGEGDADAASYRPREVLRFSLRDIVFAADEQPPLPEQHRPGQRMPKANASPAEPTPPAGASAGPLAWEAVFVPEATLTDDGRAFAPDSLSWRDLPLTLMAMIETGPGGHEGAQVSGRIDRIWRDGHLIRAAGVFDDGEYGQDIARMVSDRTLSGLSVDTAIHEYEVGPRSDYFDEDGNWLAERPEKAEAAEPSVADLLFGGDEQEPPIFVVTKGVIGMATVCPFPAFADATISLAASGAIWRYEQQSSMIVVRKPLVASAVEPLPWERATADPALLERDGLEHDHEWGGVVHGFLYCGTEACDARRRVTDEQAAVFVWKPESLSASAAGLAPLKPPAEWFENPELEELTPLTIDGDGRVYGHAWTWDTCHIAFPDACVLAPHSETQNAYFHLGEIECAEGERLPVGKVTLDAPHAGQRLSRAETTAHYDNTGTVAAHICCGEDEFGGWVAGAIHPELSEEKLRLLRGASLSGDWRNVNGNLELVALLAVNVPGFPIPRTRALVAAGDDGEDEVLALTAAGAFAECGECEENDLDLAEAAALAATAR